MRKKHHLLLYPLLLAGLGVLGLLASGAFQVINGTLTLQGIPLEIVGRALADGPARNAYLAGNPDGLHHRLQQLGIEAEIKNFYRSQIRDEYQLDQYIHQLFYSMSGYVGRAYVVNSQGILVPKDQREANFQRWFNLASAAGVVVGLRRENEIWYVISPQGTVAPYREVAKIFSEADLRNLIRLKNKLDSSPTQLPPPDRSQPPEKIFP